MSLHEPELLLEPEPEPEPEREQEQEQEQVSVHCGRTGGGRARPDSSRTWRRQATGLRSLFQGSGDGRRSQVSNGPCYSTI